MDSAKIAKIHFKMNSNVVFGKDTHTHTHTHTRIEKKCYKI